MRYCSSANVIFLPRSREPEIVPGETTRTCICVQGTLVYLIKQIHEMSLLRPINSLSPMHLYQPARQHGVVPLFAFKLHDFLAYRDLESF